MIQARSGATRRAVLSGAAGLLAAPALIGRASAAPMRMRLSSSLPNDPKYANGRVYSDKLQDALKEAGMADQITIQFFPDNQPAWAGDRRHQSGEAGGDRHDGCRARPSRPIWCRWLAC